LTKDISSRVLAEFRDDVFATRRRVQRMEQRVTKPTAEGVGTEEDRALPLTLHPARAGFARGQGEATRGQSCRMPLKVAFGEPVHRV
jgi:hypothetical protein